MSDNNINEILVTGFLGILSAVIGYVLVRAEIYFKKKGNIEIESYHREALHKALQTGARLAIAKIRNEGKGVVDATSAEMRKIVTDYVNRSVPDAIAYLNASAEHLSEMSIASVQSEAVKEDQAKAAALAASPPRYR